MRGRHWGPGAYRIVIVPAVLVYAVVSELSPRGGRRAKLGRPERDRDSPELGDDLAAAFGGATT